MPWLFFVQRLTRTALLMSTKALAATCNKCLYKGVGNDQNVAFPPSTDTDTGYTATKSKITSLKTSNALDQCRDFRSDNVHNIHLHIKAQCRAVNT